MEDFDHRQFPNRLNLGCGFDVRPDFLNVDFLEVHGPDLVGDVLDLGVLPDGHYVEIIAQDILEHVKRVDVPVALREWRRLLHPDGVLRIRVPDIVGTADVLRASRDEALHFELVQGLYGTQAYDGDYHLAGFTELTLRRQLFDADLRIVEIEHIDSWLLDCTVAAGREAEVFDPADLTLLPALSPATPDAPVPAPEPGALDRSVSRIAELLPEPAERVVRPVWQGLRRLIVRLRLL